MEGLNSGVTKDIKTKEPMPPAADDVDIIQEHTTSVTHDSSGDIQGNSGCHGNHFSGNICVTIVTKMAILLN